MIVVPNSGMVVVGDMHCYEECQVFSDNNDCCLDHSSIDHTDNHENMEAALLCLCSSEGDERDLSSTH